MKIVIGNTLLGTEFIDDLRLTFPALEFESAYTEYDRLSSIVNADVFFGLPSVDEFAVAAQLKWIHCPGTGIDEITENQSLVNSEVIVTNARGPHTEPMADHVFAFILNFAHLMREQNADQQLQRWEREKYKGHVQDLNGSTMGMLSLGGIGMAVAQRAKGFGMNIYAVDNTKMCPPDGVKDVWGLDRLDDLIRISDWFVVTSPLTPNTRNLIDSRRIGLFKRSAYLIVISRGGIVDESAMTSALELGRIAGAGLDALDIEPLPKDSLLWDMPNVIISPHVSSCSPAMYEGRKEVFKNNLQRYVDGIPLQYICDKQAGY